MKTSGGFTFIEVIIYLALFSLLMGGALISTYAIFESTERSAAKAIVQEEGRFLTAKIDWALSGVQSVDEPPVGSSGSLLSVTKFSGETVGIMPDGTNIVIRRAGGAPQPLNNTNVFVENLRFTHAYAGTGGPESVEARFTTIARTASGAEFSQEFFTIKYLRR